MRNMAVLHSPAFSYPLPVLVRVLFNLLIFKGKILYYNKYTNFDRKRKKQEIFSFLCKRKNKKSVSNRISAKKDLHLFLLLKM